LQATSAPGWSHGHPSLGDMHALGAAGMSVVPLELALAFGSTLAPSSMFSGPVAATHATVKGAIAHTAKKASATWAKREGLLLKSGVRVDCAMRLSPRDGASRLRDKGPPRRKGG
jgi:hypothetical protein